MNAVATGTEEKVQCPICGFRFSIGEASSCRGGCPFAKGCDLICCPHCGYSFVERSRILEWLKGLIRRLNKKKRSEP